MRRSLALMLICLVSLTPHIGAAQSATPVADQVPVPIVGTPFLFVGQDGLSEIAITVAAVEDPFLDAAEGVQPQEGNRFVLLTMVYENLGNRPFETRPDQIVLQDADGYLRRSTTIQRGEDVTMPDLDWITMAPGDRISGVVGFEVPEDAELARVFYQPEPSRLLVLADLQAAPVTGLEIGAATTFVDPETGAEGFITVTEVVDPFEDAPAGAEPAAGSRYVLLTVSIENSGDGLFAVNPTAFGLRDVQGYLWGTTSVQRGENIVVPDLQFQDLAPGSRISGIVGFELPVGVEIADVLYQPTSDRIIFIATLVLPD